VSSPKNIGRITTVSSHNTNTNINDCKWCINSEDRWRVVLLFKALHRLRYNQENAVFIGYNGA
jgi:predicted DNA-binding helix-hairpin-helix protein